MWHKHCKASSTTWRSNVMTPMFRHLLSVASCVKASSFGPFCHYITCYCCSSSCCLFLLLLMMLFSPNNGWSFHIWGGFRHWVLMGGIHCKWRVCMGQVYMKFAAVLDRFGLGANMGEVEANMAAKPRCHCLRLHAPFCRTSLPVFLRGSKSNKDWLHKLQLQITVAVECPNWDAETNKSHVNNH